MTGRVSVAECQRLIFGAFPHNPHLSIAEISDGITQETISGLVDAWQKEMKLTPPLQVGFSAIRVRPDRNGPGFYSMAECDLPTTEKLKVVARERLRACARCGSDYFGGGKTQHARNEPYHVTLNLKAYLSEPGMMEEFILLLKKSNGSRFAPVRRDQPLIFSRFYFSKMKPEIKTDGLTEKLETLIATLFDQTMDYRFVSGMGHFICLTTANVTPIPEHAGTLSWTNP